MMLLQVSFALAISVLVASSTRLSDTRENVGRSVNDQSWQVVESEVFPNAFMKYMIAEGLCNDRRNFIVNSKDRIYIVSDDLQTVFAENDDAIPHDLRKGYGYNHLGDCQYSQGLLYFPVEEPSYSQPAIFVYNISGSSNAIEFSTYKAQPMMRHMPWIALDPASGVLYSSEFSDADELFAFDAQSLEFLRTVPLQATLQDVQGGAFYNGSLYVGVNAKDTIYAIDVTTGAVAVACEQASDELVPWEYEFEGLTFMDLTHQGKGVMHNTGQHPACAIPLSTPTPLPMMLLLFTFTFNAIVFALKKNLV